MNEKSCSRPRYDVAASFCGVVVSCPNPCCSLRRVTGFQGTGNPDLQQGVIVEVYAQRGMTLLLCGILGSDKVACCRECGTLIPVPCIFHSAGDAQSFMDRSGYGFMRKMLREVGPRVFPSFLGRDPWDEKVFPEKRIQISQAFNGFSSWLPYLPAVILETNALGPWSSAGYQRVT